MGVYWHVGAGKWQAQIKVKHGLKYLGIFTEKSDAIAARKAAEAKYGFHENHGRKQDDE